MYVRITHMSKGCRIRPKIARQSFLKMKIDLGIKVSDTDYDFAFAFIQNLLSFLDPRFVYVSHLKLLHP